MDNKTSKTKTTPTLLESLTISPENYNNTEISMNTTSSTTKTPLGINKTPKPLLTTANYYTTKTSPPNTEFPVMFPNLLTVTTPCITLSTMILLDLTKKMLSTY